MSNRIILVTGGARSGKSTFAERFAAKQGQQVHYIATAQTLDDEMVRRVNVHRTRRPQNWVTIEAPYADKELMLQASIQADAVLFDCLTLFVSNLMFAKAAPLSVDERVGYVLEKVNGLLEGARAGQATTIFVTNEVGLGIVPDNPLAREYRDLAGMVNQAVAAAADDVYLVVSGLAVNIKQLAVNTDGERF